MNRLKLKQPEHTDEKGIVMSDLKKKFAASQRTRSIYKHRLHVTKVRCYRAWKMWEFKLPDGKLFKVNSMLITRGSFACQLRHGGSGCGSSENYSGDASGHINISDKELERIKEEGYCNQLGPIPESHKGGRRLGFDPDKGEFYDMETSEPLEKFKKLLLLPGCKAIYWP